MMDCPFLVYSILLDAIPTLGVLNFGALIWFKTLSNEMKLMAKEKLSIASKMKKKLGNFGTEVTSAPSCRLRNPMITSSPISVGMLTSAPCKKITCAEVNDLCRS